MPAQPIKAIIEYRGRCRLAEVLSLTRTVDARVKRVHHQDGRTHVWIRLRGSKESIKNTLKNLVRVAGLTHTTVNGGPNNRLVYITFPRSLCNHGEGNCILENPLNKVHIADARVAEDRLYLLVTAPSLKALEELEKRGYRVVKLLRDPEPNLLTEEQERILLRAYQMGYYDYPKRANLKDLAREFGVSVSTIAETMRRIEKKLVEKAVKEEIMFSQMIRNLTQQYDGETMDKKDPGSRR